MSVPSTCRAACVSASVIHGRAKGMVVDVFRGDLPMKTSTTIPFARPWITDAETQAALQVLGTDILTHGPQGHAFEKEFATFMGGEDVYCLSLSSGMAALHLSYFQMRIAPEDEVIVTAQTHIATAHAVEV